MNGLTKSQIMMVVNRYIGVFDGYLADFSYRSHADFYPEYCGLDLDPNDLEGTTRKRFIQILSNAEPMDQAKILQGVLARFPLEADPRPLTRTEEVRTDIEVMIFAISGGPRIASPALATRIEIVERALQDAELLIAQQGATSAVDRVHTALHAYLVGLCDSIGVEASGRRLHDVAVQDPSTATPGFEANWPPR